MFLDTATRKLELLLDGAVDTAEVQWSADYVDLNQLTQGLADTESSDGESNGATAVDLVGEPAADRTRKVNFISLYNADTAARDITVRRNDGVGTTIVWKATLQSGDMAYYTDATGWQAYSSSGAARVTSIATYADLPVGTGTWDIGAGETATISGSLVVAEGLTVAGAGTIGSVTLTGSVDVESGDLSVVRDGEGTTSVINISGDDTNRRRLAFQTGGSYRWILEVDDSGESGSDAGGLLAFWARDDSGGSIDKPLTIVRASGGEITMSRPVYIRLSGSPTAPTPGASTGFVVQRSSPAGNTSRASIIGGNTGVSELAFGDTDDEDAGQVSYNHGTDTLSLWAGATSVVAVTSAGAAVAGALSVTGTAYIGDTANADMDLGLTINQGAATNELISGKSSSVTHGMTSLAETDTFVTVVKQSAASGGASFGGYTAATRAITLAGRSTTEDTTKSTAGVGIISLDTAIKSGTSITANGATANLVSIRNGSTARYLFGNSAIFVANATSVPSASATGGGLLYSEGGALKWRGSSGTITTLGVA